ncbi:mitotic spindle assembly checkpoint protein MAD1-like [Saimiri boliviensis]|uniref:mitotic spindle assembly checkpoint protein MAD1-like n=1 Tax=Saimiri boliviensis TaxID=27679 RepID=UPI003D777053
MQMELNHKRARVELERAASTSARNYEREVDRNQELLTRIRQLQEREAGVEEKMQEQLERSRQCQQSLDATSKRLREKEDSLAQAGETINTLKGRISELQWNVMDQDMRVKHLELEKQELQEQQDLQHKPAKAAGRGVPGHCAAGPSPPWNADAAGGTRCSCPTACRSCWPGTPCRWSSFLRRRVSS